MPAQQNLNNTNNIFLQPDQNKNLSVSQAAKLLNISSSTLRRYESEGRIKSSRMGNGYRSYALRDVLIFKNDLIAEAKQLKLRKKAEQKVKTLETKISEKEVSPKIFKDQKNELAFEHISNHDVEEPEVTDVQNSNIQVINNKLNKILRINNLIKKTGYIFVVFTLLLIGNLIYSNGSKISKEIASSFSNLRDTIGDISSNDNKVASNTVLGTRSRVTNWVFNVASRAVFNNDVLIDDNLTVGGNASISGGLEIDGTLLLTDLTFNVNGSLNQLNNIDAVTQNTLQNSLVLDGDVTGPLGTNTLSNNIVDGDNLVNELTYSGILNLLSPLYIDGLSGSEGDILMSDGENVQVWVNPSELDVGFLDSLDSTSFLRSNTSDSYTSGTLSFNNSTFLDMSLINHSSNTLQGLRLPQSSSLTPLLSGEGFIAWDVTADQLMVFNGTVWESISSNNTVLTLQSAYEGGNNIALSPTFGNLEIGTSSLISFFVEDNTGNIGIGNSTPTSLLSIGSLGQVTFSSSGNLTFSDGNLLDLSGITHSDTSNQGLKLPTTDGTQGPLGNEGFIAWDSLGSRIVAWNGTNWTNISGASTSLQEAYEAGNIVQLTAAEGDLRFYNDSNSEILFLNELNGFVGIGNTSPANKLSVGSTSQFQVSSTGDLARINNVGYTFPSSQAASSNYILVNDGTGLLTWESPSFVGGVTGSAFDGQVTFWDSTSTVSGNYDFFWDNATSRLGLGTTAPAYTLDVNGDIRTSGDLYIGSIGLNDTATPTTSGAYLIGVNDEFDYSNNTNVQAVLNDLDIALGTIVGSTHPAASLTTNGLGFVTLDAGTQVFELFAVDLASEITGTLGVGNGGTGATTFTLNGIVYGNGTSALQATAAPTPGQLLVGLGSSTPGFVTMSGDATLDSNGVLTLTGTFENPLTFSNGLTRNTNTITLGGAITEDTRLYDGSYEYLFLDSSNGYVGIGNTSPANKLSVGSTSQFQVSSTGDLARINNVGYTFPSSQAASSNYILVNDGNGLLTWESPSFVGGVTGTAQIGQVTFWDSTSTVSGNYDFFWDNATSRLGLGTTAPAYTLDVNGDIRTSGDLYIGSIGLNDTATPTTSGAYLIGVNDEFDYSNNTNVQAVLNDLDIALGSLTGTSHPAASLTTNGLGFVTLDAGTQAFELFAVDLASEITGTLGVGNGGTGATTFTANGVIYGNGTSALQATAAPTPGQLLVGLGSSTPGFVTMSGDASISSTGALTLANTGVVAGTYGSSILIPQFSVDSKGRLTFADDISISYEAPLSFSNGLARNTNTITLGGAITEDTRLYDGSYEYLFLDSSNGYVGIGNTSPTALLSVGLSGQFSVTSAGNVTLSQGTVLDLSAITHSDTTPQGLRLPRTDTLSGPNDGDGYVAWDTVGNRIVAWNGVNWTNISGASTTLQEAYEAGNSIQLSVTEGDLRISNDSTNEILFLSELTGFVGIGNTSPANKLSVGDSSQFQVSSTGDLARINNVGYTFPSSQAAGVNYVLTNNGNGELTWQSLSGAGGLTGSGTTGFITRWDSSNSITDSIIFEDGGFIGLGTTAPSYTLDVNGDIRIASGSDLYIGTVGLNDTATPTTSGAYLIGVNDEFDNSNNTNIQAVLNDFDTVLGSVSGSSHPAASLTTNGLGFLTLDAGTQAFELFAIDLASEITGTLGVGNGGTGATTFTLNGVVYGNGTSALQATAAPTPGQILLGLGSSTPGFVTMTGDASITSTGALTLANTGVVAGTYGSSILIPQFSVDSKGRLTFADEISISYEAPLSFSNGLTRNANTITLGGAITEDTRLYDGSYEYLFLDSSNGYVGIGNTSPANKLSVGNASQFQVSSTGDLARINNVGYTFPSSQAASSNYILVNDGNGLLTWESPSFVGGVTGTAQTGQVTFWDSASTVSGNYDFFWDNATSRLGLGTTAPVYTLDVNGDIRTSGDLYIGSIGLNDTATPTTSGAYLIGVNDEFDYSNNTNVQAVLNDLDIALGSLTGTSHPAASLTTNGLGFVTLDAGTQAFELFAVDLASEITGTLGVGNGGTGATTFTLNGVVYGNGTSALQATAAPTPGQLLLGLGSSTPGFVTMSGDASISSTGALTLANTGVVAGTYGSSILIPQFSVDSKGRLSFADEISISYEAPLSFSNGLTRNTNTITLGGAITEDTRLYDGSYEYLFLDSSNGYVGIGNTSPANKLSVGNSNQFQVSSTGDLARINNVGYTFPSSQAASSNYILVNDGNGLLTWESPSFVGGVTGTAQIGQVTFWDSVSTVSGNYDFFWDNATSRLGLGTTAPSYTLDVNGDIRTSGDLYIGSIGLNDTATPTTSGAYLIGVNDEFDYSNNTNVQAVLNDLDIALGTLTGTSHPAASLTTNGLGFVTLDAGTQAFELFAVDLASEITGTLGVGNGGTGATTFTLNGVVFGNGTSALQATSAPTPGQLLVGLGSSTPGFVTMSGDATIDSNGVLTLTGSFENSLTFNNGLTRTGDIITLGGAITEDTRLNDGSYEYQFLDTSNGFVGIGNTAPAYKLDVTGDVRTSGDLYIGSIGLNDTATPTTSGAYLIGVNDEFDYSNNTNVQAVLNDLDIALGTLTGTSHPAASLTTNGLGFVTLDAGTQAFELFAVDLASEITGTLGVGNGGTGATTFTLNGVVYGNGTSALQATAAPTPGQLLVGLGSSTPGFVTMTGDASISSTGALTLANTGVVAGTYGSSILIPQFSVDSKGRLTFADEISISYEAPLSFSNGLTRAANTITLGGAITEDTRLYDGSYEYLFLDSSNGYVGIGNTSPANKLSVGSTSQFQVSSTGDLARINNVGYTFPSSQAASANRVLINDGNGVLSWGTVGGVGALTGSGTANYIPVFDSASSITDSVLYQSSSMIGIGNTNPINLLSVGTTGQFQVSSTGDLARINNVGYTFPSSQAASSNYILVNDGTGLLTWESPSFVGGVTGTAQIGQVTFWDSTSTVSGNYDFFWDNTTSSLGLGTTNPLASLHLSGDGSIIAAGAYGAGDVALTGAGTRLQWNARTGSFRAGTVTGTEWNTLGSYSAAFGLNNIASGTGAFSTGVSNTSSGSQSFSGGYSVTVAGSNSIGYGSSNLVSGSFSSAFGEGVQLTGSWGQFGAGQSINVAGLNSVAFGEDLTLGNADNQILLGKGVSSVTRLVHNVSNSLAVGFNSTIPTLFVGGGSGSGTLGKVGIGTTSPTSLFSVGASNQFQVSSTGDLARINNVGYTFPSSQAASSNYILVNDGNGLLTWESPSFVGGVTGTAQTGQVTFWDSTSTVSGNYDFFWDNATSRLGLGTTAPSYTLDVNGDIRTSGDLYIGSIGLNDTASPTTSGAYLIGVNDEFDYSNNTNVQAVLNDLDIALGTLTGTSHPAASLTTNGLGFVTLDAGTQAFELFAVDLASEITGTLGVGNGGTGATTFTLNGVVYGNGTSALQATAAPTPGQLLVGLGSSTPGFVTMSGDASISSTGALTLANTGVVAGTYGSSILIPQFSVDSKGRLTFADEISISYEAPLSFSNGLTRAANTITLGGAITEDTRLYDGSYEYLFLDSSNGYVGIGNTSPANKLSVGNSNQFQVSSTGDLARINNVGYTFPSSQAASANRVLTNDGNGLLTWSSIDGIGAISGSAQTGQVTFWDSASTVSGNYDFFWDNATSRLGLGTTAPSYTLDVNGDIRIASGSDLYVGTTGLNDTATPTTSGAYLIGVNDEFDYSNNTNVQAVLNDLDIALGTLTGTSHPAASLTTNGLGFVTLDAGTQAFELFAVDLASEITGTLGVGNGGTGATTFTLNGVVYGNGTSALQATAAPTPGQLLLGLGSSTPGFVTMTGDASITSTGALTLANTGVVAGTYGSSILIPQFSVDSKGRLTFADEISISYEAPLSFSNGLTRNTNTITLGGAITEDTRLYDGSYEYLFLDSSNGYVGIGNTSPANKLSVGSTSQFQVSSTGDLARINNVGYTFPSSQAASANRVLTNDGNGLLTWSSIDGIGAISGSAQTGQVTFWDSTSTVSGNYDFFWDNATSRLGLGTTAPSYTLDVNGDIRTSGDLYIGSIGLNDTATPTTSGAYLIGVNDEFDYSNNTNVQAVLNDLDIALGTLTGTSHPAASLTTNGLGFLTLDAGTQAFELFAVDLASEITGTLGVGNGGTGATTFTLNGVVYGNGTSALQATAAPTPGQLLLGLGSSTPGFVTMTGDASITSTGALTLSNTGVVAGTYGSSILIPQFSVDSKGRLTFADEISISYEAPLSFSNGLTRNTNTITLGGAITEDTRLYDGSYEYLFLDSSNGNIGIGTTFSSAKLSVSSPHAAFESASLLNLVNTGSGALGDTGRISFLSTLANGNPVTAAGIGYVTTQNIPNNHRASLVFYNTTNGASSPLTESARFTYNGNFGIGSTDPTSKLSVGSGNQFQVSSSGDLVRINNVGYTFPSSQAASANRVLSNDGNGLLSWVTVDGVGAVSGSGLEGQVTFWDTSDSVSGNYDFFWDNATSRLGLGTTAPAYTLDVNGDIRTSGDLYIGSIGLNDTATPTTSGAYLIGVNDEFDYSNNTNVQAVLNDLDIALGTLTGTSHPAASLTTNGLGFVTLDAGTQAFELFAVDLASEITGTLGIGNGGTGATTFTANGVIYGNGTSALQATAAPTPGQLLVGLGSSAPGFVTMSGDASITSTGALTLANTGVVAGTYGSSILIPQFSVDSKGRLTFADEIAFSAEAPLTFNNGLTRSGNVITLGGAITEDTRLYDGSYEYQFLDTSNGFFGIGNTAPAYKLDVTGDVRTSGDLYIGSIALNDTATPSTSGAYLIGVNDEFDYSNNTNVQAVLNDLDIALGTLTGTSHPAASLTTNGLGFVTLDAGTQAFELFAVDLASEITGTLGIGNGGTGATTFTLNGVVYGNGTSALQATAAPTPGQLLVGLGSSTPGFVTMTGDASISSTGALTLANTGVVAGTYGSSILIPQFSVDSKGRLNFADEISISYEAPLSFSNGLTRNTNTITLGGAITEDTRLYDGSYEYLFLDSSNGYVGIGNTSPANKLSVGSTSQFQVSSTGDLARINNVGYTFPSSQAASANRLLTNDGSGLLTWSSIDEIGAISGSGIAGQVTFWDSTSTVTGSNSFYWNNATSRLGLGTTAPVFSLHATDGIFADGTHGAGTVLPNVTSGTVSRMFWYPRKTAFRAVSGSSSHLNDSTIGDYSAAFGVSSLASGSYSFVFGNANTASGSAGFAGGSSVNNTGHYSFGFGQNSSLTGSNSYSLGVSTTVAGDYSLAIGRNLNTGSNSHTFVLGSGVDSTNRLVSNVGSSFNVGFNSTIPTLFVGGGSGIGTLGRVGIGNTSPTNLLSIGTSGQFGVSSTGDLARINNVGYTFPSSQAAGANYALVNDGTGVLSWTDLNANNVSGTGASGQVSFWDSSNSITGNYDFFWDNATSRLGLGTTAPSYTLDVNGDIRTSGDLYIGSIGLNDTATPTTSGAYLIGVNDEFDYSNNTNVQAVLNDLDIALGTLTGTSHPAASLTTNGLGFVTLDAGTQAFELFAVDLASEITGTLGVGNGGTGATTFALNGVVYGNGTSALQATAAPTPGQLLVGLGSSTPGFVTMTGDASISSTGALTLANTGVVAGTYGSSILIPQFSVDSKGRLTFADEISISYEAPLSFSNGLTRAANTITLGGAITEDTRLYDGSYEYLFLDSSNGYVGIGNTSPANKLSVGNSNQFQVSSTGDLARINNVGYTFPSSQAASANRVLANDGNGVLSWVTVDGIGAVAGNGIAGQVTFWNATDSITGNYDFFWDNATSRLGLGTTAPSYTLDVNGDIRIASGSDLYVGTTGLNDTATPTTSGAYLIGVNDEFDYSNNTNVQAVLNDLDIALGALTGASHPAASLTTNGLGFVTLDAGTQAFELFAVDLASEITGTLGVGNGGTGATTFTLNGVVFGNGTSALQATSAPTPGQLLVGLGSSTPGFVTMSGDASLTSTGALTLADTGVVAGTYGSSILIPQFSVDSKGRLTFADEIAFSAEAPLTFNNGLTRSGNVITLGGAITEDTRLYDGSYEYQFLDTSNGFVGIGNTAPAYKLDVNGDIRIATGSDLYVGTVGLNDTSTPTTSGAYLIGVNDEFDYSNNTNVQAVLNDLDIALGTLTGTSHPAASLTTNGLGFVTLDAGTQAFELFAVDLASEITGTLGVGNGGTGATTFTLNGVVYGNGTSALQATAAPTPGQLLVGLGSSTPGFVTMSGDATISSTGALTLANTGVVAGTYGSSILIPQFSVDSKGRLTFADEISISYEAPLSFSNGLTRAANTITLGGAITEDTRLYDGSYEYLFLEVSNGNIGVGITSPSEKLHVVGNGFITDNLYIGSTTENIANTAYSLDGDDAFILGNLGVGSTIFANSGVVVGSTLSLFDSYILDSDVLNFGANGDISNLLTLSSDSADLTIGTTGGANLIFNVAGEILLSNNVYFDDSLILDLSAIAHGSADPQGLKLPQANSLTNITGGGAGYLAYDADDQLVKVFDGSDWVNISGSASALQDAYEVGNTIELSAAEGDIRISTDSSDEVLFLQETTGFVGIGNTSPANKLSVGDASQFQVSSTGDLAKINNVGYTFPSAHGVVSSVLVNNGFGVLTWNAQSAASVADDSLDFAHFVDSMTLDASTSVNMYTGSTSEDYWFYNSNTGTNLLFLDGSSGYVGMGNTAPSAKLSVTSLNTDSALNVVANSVTSGVGSEFIFDGLTTGTGLSLTSASNALSTGSLLSLDWTPTALTAYSGNLVNINVGSSAIGGNIFGIQDSGSDIFTVSKTAITSAVPHSFTAAGDVSLAYDLIFTNQTVGNIESYGPMVLKAGESHESNLLTLQTYNSGYVNILKDNTAPSQTLLNIQGGATTTPGTGTNYITFRDGDGTILGAVEGDGSGGVTNASGGSDYAEYFSGNRNNVAPGDILALDNNGEVVKATAGSKIIGAYSMAPNTIGNWSPTAKYDTNQVLVGLLGQIPVSVDTSKGQISKGDPIAVSSDQPGKAVKAVGAGRILGFAIESSSSSKNTVNVYIAPTYHDTTLALGTYGELASSIESVYDEIDGILETSDNSIFEISTLNSAISSIQASQSSTSQDVLDLQTEVATIKELLADYGVTETTESTATDIEDVTSILGEIVSVFDEFKELISALGLSSSQNQYGENVLTVESNLAVIGETTLYDTMITGELQVGFITIDSIENSIGVLGPQCYNPLTGTKSEILCDSQTLYLQKNLAGNIDLFNGAIVLQPDGNMLVEGSIEAEKYNVDTTNTIGASAGKSTLISGTTGIIINTTAVTADSLIFITAETPTTKVLSVSSKVPGENFTVQTIGTSTTDIVFNWWIVN